MNNFIEAILPLPLPGTYTYSIPTLLRDKIAIGCRVSVPLGDKKVYTALVYEIHSRQPEGYNVKPIMELLDEEPVATSRQLLLWDWLSKYYLCSLGEIYKAAVPQGLKGEFKPRTEQRVRLVPKWNKEKDLNLLLQTLSRAPRQKRLLSTFISITGTFTENPVEISKHKLLEAAAVSPGIYKELKDKGILETYEIETGRLISQSITQNVVDNNRVLQEYKRSLYKETVRENVHQKLEELNQQKKQNQGKKSKK